MMEWNMGNKEALLIDMDGVMADTMGGLFDYMEHHHGLVLVHEDIKDYWFSGLPREDILNAMRSKGFYRHLDVITGSVRAIKRLREEYNGNVYVCSSPMAGAENCVTEKRDWLAEHYDEDFAKEAIIVPDKTLVLGHVLIEDNPGIGDGAWQPIMYDQPYNRMSQHPRMHGWHDLHVVRDYMRRPDEP